MSLSDLATSFIQTAKLKDETERNIIEFAEAPWGLGFGCTPDVPPLFPVQKFLFKCYYNIPLDDSNERPIIIKDRFNEKERFRFNEVEYLNFLRSEGRTNIDEVSGNPDDDRPNLLLVIGRRGLKTSSIAVLVAFETYKLLKKYSPQQYYKIMPDDEIRVTCVATDKNQAGELFQRITGHLERSDYFKRFRNRATINSMKLSTQRDIEKYGPAVRPSLQVVASPCSGKALRGRNNIIAVLDELAYFFESDTSTDRSDEVVYESVTPSVAKFSSPDGRPEGRIISISSPASRTGKFYQLYQRSLERDCNDLLMIQAPTWEVDYTLSPKYLRSKYAENPISFKAEFGAVFSDKISAWIENEQILRMNVVPGLKQKRLSYERVPHFIGIDVGLKEDGTSIAIGHPVKRDTPTGSKDFIELDCIETRYCFDEDKEYFRPEEMAEWISSFFKKFFIVKGLMDQYYGMAIIPILVENGVKTVQTFQATRDYNSRVYQNLMAKMFDASLRIPEGEERNENGRKTNDLPLIDELLSLQATVHSKYLISVSAPEIKGMHDDQSDAFARMVFLATEYMTSGGGIVKNNVSKVTGNSNMTYKRYLRKTKRNMAHTKRPSSAIQHAMSGGLGYGVPGFTGRR